jgi:two-component system cell cycle response regulator
MVRRIGEETDCVSGLQVVIADDDPPMLQSLSLELEDLGHRVVACAEDGLNAVRLVQACKPDLVLLDIKMPGLDGIAASQLIMERRPTPIILVSADSEADLVTRADAAGVQAYLVKPVHTGHLRPAIHLALSRFHQLQRLTTLARTDELTGLANRRALLEDMAAMRATAQRHGYPISVLLLDLNGFKQINDQLGHETGDLVLQLVAQALQAAARGGDRVYRLGGDEFVLLLPHTHASGAHHAAERYRAAIATLPLPGGFPLHASLGAASYPDEGTELEALLHLADGRMYQDKQVSKRATF